MFNEKSPWYRVRFSAGVGIFFLSSHLYWLRVFSPFWPVCIGVFFHWDKVGAHFSLKHISIKLRFRLACTLYCFMPWRLVMGTTCTCSLTYAISTINLTNILSCFIASKLLLRRIVSWVFTSVYVLLILRWMSFLRHVLGIWNAEFPHTYLLLFEAQVAC
jgi:hypothetical protein